MFELIAEVLATFRFGKQNRETALETVEEIYEELAESEEEVSQAAEEVCYRD